MALEMNDIKGYRWETGYEKSWEEIKEDEKGLGLSVLSESLALLEQRKRKQQNGKVVRLGMMRHLNVILDCSDAMLDQDLKPTRQMCTLKLLQKFIKEFLEQNPISQLGIIVTRNKRAEKISDLSGNNRKHLSHLEQCNSPTYCVGEPSLQNALELALSSMKMLPSHTSREILVLFGSLTTCDPGNIKETIEMLKTHGVKASVIGLCAEVYVLRTLCNATGGQYQIVLDDNHFQELLMNYVKPRSVSKDSEATCVKMGFPHHSENVPPFTACMCHLEDGVMNKSGYFCPQCNSKYCELPVECKTCGITLVTSAHLVRPLHNLIPIHVFKDLENSPSSDMQRQCYGCQKRINESAEQYTEIPSSARHRGVRTLQAALQILHPFGYRIGSMREDMKEILLNNQISTKDVNIFLNRELSRQTTMCNDCRQIYCLDCDVFIHSSLHMCPGCAVPTK